MPVSEQAATVQMIPELAGCGSLLGDSLYDINRLYDAAAAAGHQLLARRKRPDGGLGHCCHSPHRLRGLEILATETGRSLYARQEAIERHFGGLTNCGGGLSPLPAWVRTRRRVQLWVQAKLILNAQRLLQLRQQQPPAVA
jgi:hypothetical protein